MEREIFRPILWLIPVALVVMGSVAFATKNVEPFSLKPIGSQSVVDWNPLPAEKGTVFLFLSSICPCSAAHQESLQSLSQEYIKKGYRFFGIHSNANEPLDLAKAHFDKAKLGFPVLSDPTSKVANALGAMKTPHAYLVSNQGEVLYEGGVDNSRSAKSATRFFLRDALAAHSTGQKIKTPKARALGCMIARP